MKLKELLNLFKSKKSKIIIASVALLLIALCIFLLLHNNEPKVDTDYLIATLTKSSELTTAKLNYTGISEFKDTGIAVINKADFIMVYHATVRAGINVEDVKITADDINKIIYVDVPKAEVQEVKVDTSSIKYFDQKFALFNTDEKEDSNKAISLAEEEAKKEAAKMGILKMADEQSATLIKGILANAIPDGYRIEIKQ